MSLHVNIKKQLKNFLLEVKFDAKEGVLGVLGASGSGKSVTLKCIAGLITPDEGEIVLNGKVLFDSKKNIDISPQKRKIGYLFQSYALFPNMTVEENILIGMSEKDFAKRKKVLYDFIELLQLQGLEKQYPKQLSGGQQQRVAFARLLAYNPEVLLLDEPFSALDSHLKEQLQIQLKEILKGYQKTSVMVSHDRNEIYRLCERTMTMKSGELLQIGQTKDVFLKPEDPVTARLTGWRNLSNIIFLNENQVKAIEWNMVFHIVDCMDKKQEYNVVGLHENDVILSKEKSQNNNCFYVEIIEILEEYSKYSLLVKSVEEGNHYQIPSLENHQQALWCTLDKIEGQKWKQGEKAWLTIDVNKIKWLHS